MFEILSFFAVLLKLCESKAKLNTYFIRVSGAYMFPITIHKLVCIGLYDNVSFDVFAGEYFPIGETAGGGR